MKRDKCSKMAEAVTLCYVPSPSSLLPCTQVLQMWMLTLWCIMYTAELGMFLLHRRCVENYSLHILSSGTAAILWCATLIFAGKNWHLDSRGQKDGYMCSLFYNKHVHLYSVSTDDFYYFIFFLHMDPVCQHAWATEFSSRKFQCLFQGSYHSISLKGFKKCSHSRVYVKP